MSVEMKIDGPEQAQGDQTGAQAVLGYAADRPEGGLKVTGAAPYAAEPCPANMAHGFLVRAPGLGKVRLTNLEVVQGMAGVLTVLRDDRMIRNAAQGTSEGAPVQGVDQAEYVGQPIALVVAESFEQARHAALALRVDTAGDDLVVNPQDAVAADDDIDETAQGDLESAFASSAHRIDQTYTTPSLISAAMEPHAALAEWDGDKLVLRASLQMLKYSRTEIADCVGIAPEDVRVLAPYVGGGFGSKLGICAEAVAAALAARQLGRPVRVVQHRRQVFEVNTRRSETTQRIRLCADMNGQLTGIGHQALVSNLPGEDFAEPVLQATHFAYAAPNRLLRREVLRLHRPAAGSVRAPGEAVGVTAFEIAMDELACAAGIDPVALRLRNIPRNDPESGLPFSSHRLAECLTDGSRRFGWSKRPTAPRQQREGEWWIGTGMAAAFRVNSMMEAEARVVLSAQGVRVETDMTDIGTASYAILGQIAAERLGHPLSRTEVILGDTDLPPSSGSGGSFGAASTGTAVWLACEELRRMLAGRMGCDAADLTLKDGYALCDNRRRAIADLLDGASVTGHGRVQPGEAGDKVRQATTGAHFAEVAVSDMTGEVRVRRLAGTYAAGRILNPRTARSQCHGGMTWGIGMALTEALIHDRRDGHVVNRDFEAFHLPVNADVPDLDVAFVEDRDDWLGPLRAKGLGELSICGAAAAVINAVHHACGVRVRDLPATPDRVLEGLV
ncbi:xanthine dehydrogenase family protein molybdopterin-binding subunit [Pararhodobacter zhoushanensis]|uniref:xanthine dehydrogenase family protein molybdopterin-binding subunit n=1 Tax=Pararhodobacter zhoushanensis TaxID=2479545 RepID=UPI000F8EB016|nr:xanthine dehydrogenase family protein molybdopterin-binding subunit [Pararhodobacter zhoushanensis]